MKLSLALSLAAIPFVSASYPRIAGYEPASQVTDHNALDLDQAAIESQLADATNESFLGAKSVYEKGGHSKSYAMITLTTPLTSDVTSKTKITGTAFDGTTVTGSAYEDTSAGSTVLKVKYPTRDVQENHVKCKVGGLPATDHVYDGCLEADGSVLIGDGATATSYDYSYTIQENNYNGRHIAGFSIQAQSKMTGHDEYMKYYNYYGEGDYAHQWVTAALDGKSTSFSKGNADFSLYGFTGRTEAIKKGTAYMNVYMYVIREFEDAIDDCNAGCIECNFGQVHAWDEGVAFWTGSLEGEDGSGSGKLLYALADKRCQNYKTCGLDGNELQGTSYINYELFNLFTLGQYNLQTGNCAAVRKNTDDIIALMAVPLIQGTLRYAYKVDELEGAEKEKAEGAVFAASILPRVAACNADDAQTIYDNMRVGASSTDFKAVRKAFENNYDCMGTNGKIVGGLWNDATQSYFEGMEPKKDGSTGPNRLAIGLGVGFGIAGFIGIAFIVHMIRKEKAGKPIFMATSDEGDAV